MSCDLIKIQIVEYLRGELDNSEHIRIESHIAGCEKCRTLMQDLSALWCELEAESQVYPSQQAHKRFYDRLSSQEAAVYGNQNSRTPQSWFSSLWPTRPPWALAFSFVALTCGYLVGVASSTAVPSSESNELAQIQGELVEIQDLLIVTLLQQNSIQGRLRGVYYALQTGSNNPAVVDLLLAAAEQDRMANVRLAALGALELHQDKQQVRERLYQSLMEEPSPLVQLKKAELLLTAASGDQRKQLLDTLIAEQALESGVREILRELGQNNELNQSEGRLIEL